MPLRHNFIKRLPQIIRHFSNKASTFEEIRIPVPWGHVAGKWWGPQDKRPILCTHGWEDNCGTFDTLIPRLPSHLGYLAIDFPGHGLSSQLATGVFYHRIDSVILIKRIVDYFNWSKVSLLGHSMGSIINYQYNVLYPNMVDFMICIDGVKPLVQDDKKIERMVKIINSFVKYDHLNNLGKEAPAYSFEELEKMLHEGTMRSIDLSSCKYILERNVVQSTKEPDKYCLKRDARLKALFESDLLGWAQKDIVDSAHRIICPIFISKATYSPFFENKNNAIEVMEMINKNNKYFEYHDVDGTHHVHLNNPERLDGIIGTFLAKYDVEDRCDGGIKEEMKFKQTEIRRSL